METALTAECVLRSDAVLGEGPVWDTARQACWWVDIVEGRVHRFDPATGGDEVHSLDRMVGAVALRDDGTLLLAAQQDFAILDPETGAVTPYESGIRIEPGVRFNDGKCDAAGRFWIGTMALDAAEGKGDLYCLYPDGRTERKLSGVTISNGMAWTADGRTLYYVDSPTQCVFAFDYDVDTARIANRRVVVRVPEDSGTPDGMTIDVEGMLWIAHWGGSRVCRWDPRTGKLIGGIRVPARQVTACTFGGADLDRLFITTAREGLGEADLDAQPLAGSLFCVEPQVQGTAPVRFSG